MVDKDLVRKMQEYIRDKGSNFLKDENITSIGIGFKIKDGKRTNELAFQFSVASKVESQEKIESLNSREIQKTIEIDGVKIPTDVIQKHYKPKYGLAKETSVNVRKNRMDPLASGVSVSNAKCSAGTLGAIVYDEQDGAPYLLSNWHVLHGKEGEIGDSIVQPGGRDNDKEEMNHAGRLIRSYVGKEGDCAIATIEGRGFTEEIYGLGTKICELGDPELLDKVVKSGRTTGVTFGVIVRINVLIKLYYGKGVGYKEIECFEIAVDDEYPPEDGEISSGGDSGSVWMIAEDGKATGKMAGLHFAGETSRDVYEHALACYPKPVFRKLGIRLSDTERIVTCDNQGFNENFLSIKISVPKLKDDSIAFATKNSVKIDYTHFSLALHKKRRLAIWVAWNIDGGKVKRVSRSGMNYGFDSRIPLEYQVGNELYKQNDLDRGHIARRGDLIWGTIEEAKKASRDSFYYTNIAPQMCDFNQSSKGGIWGKLEDSVFNEVDVRDLRISVVGGPVFQESDRDYRGVKIPHEFYKVIIYEAEGEVRAKGFLLTQSIDRIEVLGADEFKVYEVSLDEIEKRCGFTFDNILHTAGPGSQTECMKEKKALSSVDDIEW